MAVYVDPVFACKPNRRWRWSSACHMFADSLDELHAMASKLGLRREWFQGGDSLQHYDLTGGKRQQAVRLGAVEVDRRFAADFVIRSRRSCEKCDKPISHTARPSGRCRMCGQTFCGECGGYVVVPGGTTTPRCNDCNDW